MRCSLKRLGQIQCAEVPQCLSSNQRFFDILGRQLSPSTYTFPSSQSHIPHPRHKSFAQRTMMMTFDRRLRKTLLVR